MVYIQSYKAPGGLCGVDFLRVYLQRVEQLIGRNPLSLPHSTPLFPVAWLEQSRRPLPKTTFVEHMRAFLLSAGIPAYEYSGHSFRSGSATDLYYAECRPYIIQRLGRWRSDA